MGFVVNRRKGAWMYAPERNKTKLPGGLFDAMRRQQNLLPCLAPKILASHSSFYSVREHKARAVRATQTY